jgi:hypothetical protein
VGGEIGVEKITPLQSEIFEAEEMFHGEGEKPGNPRGFVACHPPFGMMSSQGNNQ